MRRNGAKKEVEKVTEDGKKKQTERQENVRRDDAESKAEKRTRLVA